MEGKEVLPLVNAVVIYMKNGLMWNIAAFLIILEVSVSIVEIPAVISSQFTQYSFNIPDRKSHK